MVVVDETGRHAMEVVDKSKTKGIIVMPIAVWTLQKHRESSRRKNVGIVAGRAVERACA